MLPIALWDWLLRQTTYDRSEEIQERGEQGFEHRIVMSGFIITNTEFHFFHGL